MADPDYNHYLRMARHTKSSHNEILAAINQVMEAQHGVVALVFTNQGRDMEIRILDEPFEENVRMFPGE